MIHRVQLGSLVPPFCGWSRLAAFRLHDSSYGRDRASARGNYFKPHPQVPEFFTHVGTQQLEPPGSRNFINFGHE
jgi:hypothetical protein